MVSWTICPHCRAEYRTQTHECASATLIRIIDKANETIRELELELALLRSEIPDD